MPDIKLKKTHTKNIIAWGILVYFSAVACFYFAALIPLQKQLIFLEQKTSRVKQTVNQLKNEYAQKWDDEKEEIAEIIQSFKQKKENEKDIIFSEFFQLSKEFGINVEKAEPLEEESLGDTMLKYSWKISCYADYPALGVFFNKIENSPLFLCVESPDIQSEGDRKTKKHKADFLLSTYRLKIKK